MIELQIKKIKIKMGAEEWDLRHPSVRELKEYAKDDSDELDKTIMLLDKCGLPSIVAESLDVESLQTVLGAITPAKKD